MLYLLLLGMPLLAIANVFTVVVFHRWSAKVWWWAVLVIAWWAGTSLGIWGCVFEYQPAPRLRIIGAPVPVVFLHLEGPSGEEQWVDYVTEVPILFAASDVLIMVFLAGCPVGLAFWLTRGGRRQVIEGSAPIQDDGWASVDDSSESNG